MQLFISTEHLDWHFTLSQDRVIIYSCFTSLMWLREIRYSEGPPSLLWDKRVIIICNLRAIITPSRTRSLQSDLSKVCDVKFISSRSARVSCERIVFLKVVITCCLEGGYHLIIKVRRAAAHVVSYITSSAWVHRSQINIGAHYLIGLQKFLDDRFILFKPVMLQGFTGCRSLIGLRFKHPENQFLTL